jgi:hypothetical protein
MVWGQTPAVPSWLVSYPGADARTRSTPGLVESTYETEAGASEVIAHYRRLFEASGVDFHANFDGVGTAVRVDVAAKVASVVAPAVGPRVQKSGREHVRNMERYDQPMRPPRRPPPPALVWPAWLVNVDGSRMEIEKGVDKVGLKTLHSRYVSDAERNVIQEFYAGLLSGHGFPVRM